MFNENPSRNFRALSCEMRNVESEPNRSPTGLQTGLDNIISDFYPRQRPALFPSQCFG
jgi:hypothetical protein